MIISLLYVGLLCMGVGAKASTPIILNRQETTQIQKQQRQLNEENDRTLSFNHTFNLSASSNINSIALNETENYTPSQDYPAYDVIAYTYQSVTYIDALSISGQIRDENLMLGRLDHPTPYFGIGLPYQAYPTHETSSLWLMQIDPTAYMVDSTSTLTLRLSGAIHNWSADNNETINMNTNILISTQDTWSQYMGLSVNTTYKYNWQLYQNITSGTLGTNYNQFTYNNQFQVSGIYSEQNYSIETEININPTKTNYLVIYQEPTVVDNDASPYAIIEQQDNHTPSNYFYANIFNAENERRYLTLEGTYIVPPSSYEVVDIPGMMWEILTMPFSFISVAFNLTLFPGTPYQLNLSNLIMSIFGVLVFIFIFKLILKR